MKCELCDRENLSAKELAAHRKFFHRIGYVASTPREAIQQPVVTVTTNDTCPDCGAALYFHEGCESCLSCGFSKCG